MLKHAMDVKVNVRPIFSNVVHTAVWEGPCRVGRPEILSPEYESRAGKEEFKSWKKTVVEGICAEANVLEPLYIPMKSSMSSLPILRKQTFSSSHIASPASNASAYPFQ